MTIKKNTEQQKQPIIFFITQTRPGNGGVESITFVIESLKDFVPIIITNMELPINQRWRDSGAEVQYWPLFTIFSPMKFPILKLIYKLGLWFFNNFRSYREVRQLNCKVVHFNDIQGITIGGLGAKLAGASIIFNIRDTKIDKNLYNLKHINWIIASRLSDKIVVLSKEMRSVWSKTLRLKNKNKITYIYSTINTKLFQPVSADEKKAIRKKLGIPLNTIAIGYIASVTPKKNQLNLINNGARLLKQSLPEARLYLVGSFNSGNIYAQDCQKALCKEGVNNVVSLVGHSSSVQEWYQAMDVNIVVSVREGLARCMIESLACGIPVVSFPVCSAQEILLEYNCGMVVEMENYSQLIHGLVRILNDQDLYSMYRKNSFTIASKLFTLNNAFYYENIYKECLKSNIS